MQRNAQLPDHSEAADEETLMENHGSKNQQTATAQESVIFTAYHKILSHVLFYISFNTIFNSVSEELTGKQ